MTIEPEVETTASSNSERIVRLYQELLEAEAAKKRDAVCHREEIKRIKEELSELMDSEDVTIDND